MLAALSMGVKCQRRGKVGPICNCSWFSKAARGFTAGYRKAKYYVLIPCLNQTSSTSKTWEINIIQLLTPSRVPDADLHITLQLLSLSNIPKTWWNVTTSLRDAVWYGSKWTMLAYLESLCPVALILTRKSTLSELEFKGKKESRIGRASLHSFTHSSRG